MMSHDTLTKNELSFKIVQQSYTTIIQEVTPEKSKNDKLSSIGCCTVHCVYHLFVRSCLHISLRQ